MHIYFKWACSMNAIKVIIQLPGRRDTILDEDNVGLNLKVNFSKIRGQHIVKTDILGSLLQVLGTEKFEQISVLQAFLHETLGQKQLSPIFCKARHSPWPL